VSESLSEFPSVGRYLTLPRSSSAAKRQVSTVSASMTTPQVAVTLTWRWRWQAGQLTAFNYSRPLQALWFGIPCFSLR
jgi:hypothetical protein